MKTTNFAEEAIKYDAPQVEMIEVEVEKGFAQSSGFTPNPDTGE